MMLLALALTALAQLSACSKAPRVPAANELAPVDEDIRSRIRAQSAGTLEPALEGISREHGENSMAMVQALTDAGVLLAGELDAPLAAVPYFRRALEAAEQVYGHEHRETAFALHDYGEIQIRAANGGYLPAVTPLYEEALAVRRRVLGERAPETAASGASLAKQLVRACETEPPCRPTDARLAEALRLTKHAIDVFQKEGRDAPQDARSASELLARIIALRSAVPKP